MQLDDDQDVYIYRTKGVIAWAADVWGDPPQFWLLAGSMIVGDERCVTSCEKSVLRERSSMSKWLRKEGQNFVLETDWIFEPTKHRHEKTGKTLAANVVAGNNQSGPKMWEKDVGDSLRWLREQYLFGEWRRIRVPPNQSEMTLHVPRRGRLTTSEAFTQFTDTAADAILSCDPSPVKRLIQHEV